MECPARPVYKIYTHCLYCGIPFTYPQTDPYCWPPPTTHVDPRTGKHYSVQFRECRDKHESLQGPKLYGSVFNSCTCKSFEIAQNIHMSQVIGKVAGLYARYGNESDIYFKKERLESIYIYKVVPRWYRNNWNDKFESKVAQGVYINYFDWLYQNMRNVVAKERRKKPKSISSPVIPAGVKLTDRQKQILNLISRRITGRELAILLGTTLAGARSAKSKVLQKIKRDK